jgi:hypothetical protein
MSAYTALNVSTNSQTKLDITPCTRGNRLETSDQATTALYVANLYLRTEAREGPRDPQYAASNTQFDLSCTRQSTRCVESGPDDLRCAWGRHHEKSDLTVGAFPGRFASLSKLIFCVCVYNICCDAGTGYEVVDQTG